MEDFENERDEIKRSVEVSRIMADVMQHQNRENVFHWISNIVEMVILMVMALSIVFLARNTEKAVSEAISENQQQIIDAFVQAVDQFDEIEFGDEVITNSTRTESQFISGDSAVVNNVEGEQFNENARKVGD